MLPVFFHYCVPVNLVVNFLLDSYHNQGGIQLCHSAQLDPETVVWGVSLPLQSVSRQQISLILIILLELPSDTKPALNPFRG